MGTLTADVPRLDEHCPHKLPTSCRLTSIPKCCACADNRSHSPTYSKYIDGVGFVQRGTRWEAYCWFCKTFWGNRLSASGLDPRESQIPDRPDVSEFIETWFEYHQGYRIQRCEDGTEEWVSIFGEELKDVAPGTLPRTFEEMQAETSSRRPIPIAIQSSRSRRIEETVARIRNRTISELTRRSVRWADSSRVPVDTAAPFQSIEDTIDDLIAQADEPEEAESQPLLASLQHDDAQLRTSVPSLPSGSQQTNGTVRDFLYHPTGDIQELSESRRQQRQRRFTERMTRLFGSREDIQSEEYVSPIAGMFNRAWGRYRNMEELRRAQDNSDAVETFLENARRESPAWFMTVSAQITLSNLEQNPVYHGDGRLSAVREFVTTERARIARRADGGMARAQRQQAESNAQRWSNADSEQEFPGLDGDDRPEPMTDEQMTITLECKVCLQQRATVACLPCGHLGLCTWCADQIIPVRESDKTKPVGHKRCPLCRKHVNRRVLIFIP